MVAYKLKRDSRKFVVVPSTGNRYFFEGNSVITPKSDEDAAYFASFSDAFEAIEIEVVNRAGDDPAMSTMVKEGSTPASPSTPSNSTPGDDVKAMETDDSVEDALFAENPDGPWDCPVCGKKGLTSKSGVRSHIGSKKCTETARKNIENDE